MIPSPVQGALAVEIKHAISETAATLARLDDAPTRKAVEFERHVMRALGGGCSMPLGVYARFEGERLRVDAFYSEADGSRFKRLSRELTGTPAEAQRLAEELKG